MTRSEKIALLAESEKHEFLHQLMTLTDRHTENAAALISKRISLPEFQLRQSCIAAELLIAAQVMIAATGTATQVNDLATKILNDRTELRRLALRKSTGHKVLRCDHCQSFRPVGIHPVDGTCCLSIDPRQRPLVSADSFCQSVAPFTRTCRRREVTHA